MSELRHSPRAVSAASKSGVRLKALALCALLSSCLVTNKVDYDQDIILSVVKRSSPESEFVRVPVEPDEACRESFGAFQFSVAISDLNREEELELRYVVNGVDADTFPVPLTGGEDRGVVAFCIPAGTLNESCNLVEALVSSSFHPSNRRPYEARLDDIASAHWWVIGNAEDNPAASYLDCPDPRPDAGAP